MKQHKRRCQQLLLIVIAIVLLNMQGQGQTVLALDSLVNMEDEVIQFLNKKGWLPDIDLEQLEVLEQLGTYQQQLNLRQAIQQKKAQVSTQFHNRNYFFHGDTIFSQGIGARFYSELGVQSKLSLQQIPVVFRGNAVLVEGKFQPQLSTLSFSFDANAFVEQMKNKYEEKINPQATLALDNNPLQLSEEELKTLKSELQYTIYQRVINNTKFINYKSLIGQKMDSLVLQQVDGLLPDSTILDTIRTQLDEIKAIETQYEKYWELKKKVDFKVLKNIKTKTDSVVATLKEQAHPENFKKHLLQQSKVKSLERFFLLTKAMDVGMFNLEDSDLVAKYLTLNGIHYSFEGNKLFGEVAYGNQSLTTAFLPSFNALWLNRYYGRRFLFAKVGVKSENETTRTQFSFLQADDRPHPEDSLFIFPKRNRVLAWSGQMGLGQNKYLRLDAAISEQTLGILGNTNGGNDNGVDEDRVALNLMSGYQWKKLNASMELGYFYHGANYLSLGNPFLLTNRQGLSWNAKIEGFKNKLSLSLDAKYGKAIKEENALGFRDFQLLGELRYQFAKQSAISLRMMPNVYQQSHPNHLARTQNLIYSLQSSWHTNIKKSQLLSVWSLTNLRTDFEVIDTVRVESFAYSYLQEVLMFPNGHTLNATAMMGFKHKKWLSEFSEALMDLNYSLPLAAFKMGIGSQLIKRQLYQEWQYGFTGQLSCAFSKKGNLAAHLTFRNKLNRSTANLKQLFGNVTFRLQL